MKTTRARAIVLRRTNYGEADRILQLLTPEGRRSVIARGVRREKSKLAGGIELFAVCDVVIAEGKGELDILTSARLVRFYQHILSDYDRMQFGYEVIKRVARATEQIDEPEWFDVLEQVFDGLDDMSVHILLIQTWFYVAHASLLGHELSLSYDVDGRRLSKELKYRYDTQEQSLREAHDGDVSQDHIKLLRLIAHKQLRTVAQIGGVESVLPVCCMVAREHASL